MRYFSSPAKDGGFDANNSRGVDGNGTASSSRSSSVLSQKYDNPVISSHSVASKGRAHAVTDDDMMRTPSSPATNRLLNQEKPRVPGFPVGARHSLKQLRDIFPSLGRPADGSSNDNDDDDSDGSAYTYATEDEFEGCHSGFLIPLDQFKTTTRTGLHTTADATGGSDERVNAVIAKDFSGLPFYPVEPKSSVDLAADEANIDDPMFGNIASDALPAAHNFTVQDMDDVFSIACAANGLPALPVSSAQEKLSKNSATSTHQPPMVGAHSNPTMPTPPLARSTPARLFYVAPTTKPLPPGVGYHANPLAPNSICHPVNDYQGPNNDKCAICLIKFVPEAMSVQLKKCGHIFHLHCIREAVMHQARCPECLSSVLLTVEDQLAYLRGNMPSGEMECYEDPLKSCAGYEGRGSIVINYNIYSSSQQSYHPHPGQIHSADFRTAYLPANPEGLELLCRLKAAFLCGLTFTIGTSLTTNREDSVTWGSIHHKTSIYGGVLSHGFPDTNHMTNCNSELDAAGVPPADACSVYVAKRERNYFNGQSFSRKVEEPVFNSRAMVDLDALIASICSDKFICDITASSGINVTQISINPHLGESSNMQKFIQEDKDCFEKGDKYDVKVLFHGTDERNVDAILRDGLDPSLRKNQAYGQGEYFATSPAMTLHYCRGGKKILVFAVITESCDMHAYDGGHIFVVKKSERQLPIATLSFDSYGPQASTVANSFQTKVQKLRDEVKNKEKTLQEAHTKERIVRLIIAKEYAGASEIYNKACDNNVFKGFPPPSWAEEVATYVRDHIRDDNEVEIYFPNLPRRPVKSVNVLMLDIERCEAEVVEAKSEYEAIMKKRGILS